jgi:hypothetical protein
MAWTTYPDSTFDTGKPGKGSIIENIYKNITAVANGDSGAPEIQTSAYAAQSVDTAAIKNQNVTAAKLPNFTTGSYQIADSSAEESTTSETYVKLKEIYVGRAGTVTTFFYLKCLTDNAWGRVYKNGTAVGTERNTTSQSYVSYSENITVAAGDLIQLYAHSTGGDTAYVKNFQIRIGNPISAAVVS